jgi:hypothetical protein
VQRNPPMERSGRLQRNVVAGLQLEYAVEHQVPRVAGHAGSVETLSAS